MPVDDHRGLQTNTFTLCFKMARFVLAYKFRPSARERCLHPDVPVKARVISKYLPVG